MVVSYDEGKAVFEVGYGPAEDEVTITSGRHGWALMMETFDTYSEPVSAEEHTHCWNVLPKGMQLIIVPRAELERGES
jgi:hypothetical protein